VHIRRGTVTFAMLVVMRRSVERREPPNGVTASRVEHGKVVRPRGHSLRLRQSDDGEITSPDA